MRRKKGDMRKISNLARDRDRSIETEKQTERQMESQRNIQTETSSNYENIIKFEEENRKVRSWKTNEKKKYKVEYYLNREGQTD